MWLEKNGKVFVSLPGVPYEMKALISNEVIPALRSKFKFPYIKHKTVLTYGLGESAIANRIEAWEDALPDFLKLAYLPSLGRVRLRISGKTNDKSQLEQAIEEQVQLLLPQIADIFVGFEDEGTIEVIVGNLLKQNEKTLAVAESCTGGLIAKSLTANAGASSYFKGSVVTYATESKVNVLKVSEDDIKKYSVVSQQVAEQMAENVRQLYNADYGISTTGNAGPSKGDSDAEVGTVWIAIATKEGTISQVFNFGNHRDKVIMKATNKAFEMLQKEILKK